MVAYMGINLLTLVFRPLITELSLMISQSDYFENVPSFESRPPVLLIISSNKSYL